MNPTTRFSGRSLKSAVLIIVAAGFFTAGALRQPVPGNNEPHYLSKAKHYWNPEWCGDDLFLNSADSHLVFVQTAGVITQFVSLDATAWIGRVLCALLLAWGWCRLTWVLCEKRWAPIVSMGMFVLLTGFGDVSGEWVLGGFEGKVPAYALLFLAAANALEGNAYRATICTGLSVSFHPLVGLWGVIAAGAPLLFAGARRIGEVIRSRKTWLAFATFLAAASWGLIPALLLVGNADPGASDEAAYLQVFNRLQHHLDPLAFPAKDWLLGLGWLVVMSAFAVIGWHEVKTRRLVQFAGGAILIAAVGVAIAWGPRTDIDDYTAKKEWLEENLPGMTLRAKLLRFYPFRLADAMLPAAVALAAAIAASRLARRPHFHISAAAIGLGIGILNPMAHENPTRTTATEFEAWKETCAWARENTPPDAVFLTPPMSFAFKWYAHRAEYATTKDCPQDADSIMQWLGRLATLTQWKIEARQGGYTSDDFRELRRRTGCRYLISPAKLPIAPVFRNAVYSVYQLP